jgi:hypothetical protein
MDSDEYSATLVSHHPTLLCTWFFAGINYPFCCTGNYNIWNNYSTNYGSHFATLADPILQLSFFECFLHLYKSKNENDSA